MVWGYFKLADLLLSAEAVLDNPAEDLAQAGRLELAESALHGPAATFAGVEFYPDLARKAATVAIIEGSPPATSTKAPSPLGSCNALA